MTETAMTNPCPNVDCVFIAGHDGICSNQMGMPIPSPQETSDVHGDGGWDASIFPDPGAFPMTVGSPSIRTTNISDVRYSGVSGPKYLTEQAAEIMEHLVPQWRDLFLQKNAKYRAVGNDLGARGVFPDINRKTGILKDRIWDGNPEIGEPTREVIFDLVGHLFLMLYMMEKGD